MAYNISNYMGTLLNLHSTLRRPMTKSAVLAICRMAELLKSIQATYHRSSLDVIEFITLAVNEYELIILDALERMTVCNINSFLFLYLSLPPSLPPSLSLPSSLPLPPSLTPSLSLLPLSLFSFSPSLFTSPFLSLSFSPSHFLL